MSSIQFFILFFKFLQLCQNVVVSHLYLLVLLLQVHRLVVVDDDNKVVGVVSLSDILSYIVLRPVSDMKTQNEVIQRKLHVPNSAPPSLSTLPTVTP